MFFDAFSGLELRKSPQEFDRLCGQRVSTKFDLPVYTGSTVCIHFIPVFEVLQCINCGNCVFTYSLIRLFTGLLFSWRKIEFLKLNWTFRSLQLRLFDYDRRGRSWSKNSWSELASLGCTLKSTISSCSRYNFNEKDEKTTGNCVYELLQHRSIINFSGSYDNP